MTYFKLVLTAVFWGGTFIAGRMIAPLIDPCSAAFLRFFIASAFLILLTVKRNGRLPKPDRYQFIMIILLGMTGIFSYNLFFFSGLHHIQANQAALIIANNPIFISLCSALFFKEILTRTKITGLCLSVTGALIVISKGNLLHILTLGIGRGEILIFGCVASWVAYSLLGKKAMTDLTPMTWVCYSSVAGTIMLFFPAVFQGGLKNLPAFGLIEWSSLFYLGFFGTVLGFLWYYEGIQKIGPMNAGIFINLVPVSAIVMSFFILDEPLTRSLLLGALLVTAGVWLTNTNAFTGKKERIHHVHKRHR